MQYSAHSHQVESDPNAPTMTRAEGWKKKAEKSLENHSNPQPASTQFKPTRTEEDQVSQTAPSNTQTGKIPQAAKIVGAAANVGGTGVENAVRKEQEKVRLETEKRDAMWRRIAKAVDDAIGVETPGDIEAHNINHIVNAILDFALLKAQLVEKTSQKGKNEKKNSITQEAASSTKLNEAVQLPEKQGT